MNAYDRQLVVELCADRAGLRVDPEKAYLIENRLAPIARQGGYGSIHDLLAAVRDRDDERLAWAVIEALSPAEGGFFRDPATLDFLIDELLARGPSGGPLRIWVAACGAGQEAYSLAMLLHERMAKAADVELFASDLSERRLETAQAGVYSAFEAQRGLSARRLVRHFERSGEGFALSPHLRRTVVWRRVNLQDDLSRLGRFDLILCRGILGGLLEPARVRVLAGLAGALKPDGRLVLGAAEAAPALRSLAGPPGVFAPPSAARAAA